MLCQCLVWFKAINASCITASGVQGYQKKSNVVCHRFPSHTFLLLSPWAGHVNIEMRFSILLVLLHAISFHRFSLSILLTVNGAVRS